MTGSRPRARRQPTPREERRDGRRVAQLFREVRGLEGVKCCDLEAIMDQDDLVLAYSESAHPGYAAALMRTDGCCGIILPRGQSGGRKRFSIAHELGHYHIPSHSQVAGFCTDADLRAAENDAARLQEWEANDFAAELLMPRRHFVADVSAREISAAAAIELSGAAHYDVSIMAAAIRMVDTTREPAAIVVSANGRIQWSRRSGSFSLWLPGNGSPLHHDSMAAASHRRVETSDRPKPVPAEAWTDRRRKVPGELLESTYRIDSQEQIVSLLWHVGADDDADDV